MEMREGEGRMVAYHDSVINGLSDELLLAEGVASFGRDSIDGPLVHLMLDSTTKHVQRFPGALAEELVQEEGEPRRQHLFSNTLRSEMDKQNQDL